MNVRAAQPVCPYPEQTSVRLEIPTRSGGALMCGVTVDHYGNTVHHVHLPPHFRDYAVAAGLERDDVDFEIYLCVLAKMAFARTGGGDRHAAPVISTKEHQ